MSERIDVLPTLIRKSRLPEKLTTINEEWITPNIKNVCDRISTLDGVVLLSGIKRGKTTNAAAIMLAYLNQRRYFLDTNDVALYLSVNQLCYENRTQDRYQRNNDLQQLIRSATNARCLILDGLFSYLTQMDDLMLQAIYDARQYKSGITIVTTPVSDPVNCAGSILYRIARDAVIKEEF